MLDWFFVYCIKDVEMEPSTAVNCRVYVGNLSWSIKSPDLKEHMETAGPVEAATVLEWNGRSKVRVKTAVNTTAMYTINCVWCT